MTTGPHDPTRSGSVATPTSAATVRLSRNEIETLCLKAARGAGMDWGTAEEAGFAAGWLADKGIDGAAALLAHLDAVRRADWSACSPVVGHGCWQSAEDAVLCPIALGAALSDHGMLPEGPMAKGGFRTGPVGQPILVLPFLAFLAQNAGGPVSLCWPEGCVTVMDDGFYPADAADALTATAVARLEIHGGPRPTTHIPPRGLSAVSSDTVARLNAYAMRTTVPASETSRQGAGAVAGDND